MISTRQRLALIFCFALALGAKAAHATDFYSLPGSNNTYPNQIVIGMPPNCPSQQAQYGRAMAATLQEQGWPVQVVDQIGFHWDGAAEQAQILAIMDRVNNNGPPVLINGRIAGAPTMEQLYGELRMQYDAGYFK